MGTKLTDAKKEEIRHRVQDGMAWLLEDYTIHKVIEYILPSEQQQWAKDNLDWTVVILGACDQCQAEYASQYVNTSLDE